MQVLLPASKLLEHYQFKLTAHIGTATIGYYGMVSRILVALQIELEPGEKAFIPKY